MIAIRYGNHTLAFLLVFPHETSNLRIYTPGKVFESTLDFVKAWSRVRILIPTLSNQGGYFFGPFLFNGRSNALLKDTIEKHSLCIHSERRFQCHKEPH